MAAAATPRAAAAGDTIRDNSFLIEEAYNQEPGVVQHIVTFDARDGDWLTAFTQEWPVKGLRHQLSFTLGLQNVAAHVGIGDLAINYRYQLTGGSEQRLAVSPRVSMLLPSGNAAKGLGAGGAGVQMNLPVSCEVSRHLVAHANAGLTYTPHAEDAAGETAGTLAVAAGGSLIWLAHRHFNLIAELLWTHGQTVAAPGETKWESTLTVSPGLRASIDFASGLQIVPGFAVPLGVGPTRGVNGVFLYLSFEHRYRKP